MEKNNSFKFKIVAVLILLASVWFFIPSQKDGTFSFDSPLEKATRQPANQNDNPLNQKQIQAVKSLAELNERYPGGKFNTFTNPAGLIHTLMGKKPTGLDFNVDDPDVLRKTQEEAQNFLAEIAPLLDIDSLSQLQVQNHIQDTPSWKKVYFDQLYDAGDGHEPYEVYGGSLSVLFNSQGDISLVNNLYIPGVKNVDLSGTFAYDKAAEAAINDAGIPYDEITTRLGSDGKPVPVVKMNEQSEPRLAWLVQITQVKKAAVWLYFFDKATGSQIGQRTNEAIH